MVPAFDNTGSVTARMKELLTPGTLITHIDETCIERLEYRQCLETLRLSDQRHLTTLRDPFLDTLQFEQSGLHSVLRGENSLSTRRHGEAEPVLGYQGCHLH